MLIFIHSYQAVDPHLSASAVCEYVSGAGLPDPGADVDASFRFLLDLSPKLGGLHFFSAGPLLPHHA